MTFLSLAVPVGALCKVLATLGISLEDWNFLFQPKALQEVAFPVQQEGKTRKRAVGKSDCESLYFLTLVPGFLDDKSLYHMPAMKQLSGQEIRNMSEGASHCLYLPCLALAFPDSPINAVAALSPLLLLCKQQHLGEVCSLSTCTSQSNTTASASPPDTSGKPFQTMTDRVLLCVHFSPQGYGAHRTICKPSKSNYSLGIVRKTQK